MTSQSITDRFKNASVLIKIIVINVVIFIGLGLASLFSGLSKYALEALFVLPYDFMAYLNQPWSLLSYSFLHSGIWHVGINMYMLYWFGNLVLNLFSGKRFLTIYLLGGIMGGLFFLLSYNLFPLSATPGPVVGASGAVMAIMVFMATYAPNTEVRIIKWNLKLWHVVGFFVLIDLVRLPTSGNAGGLLVHVGGAIFGYIYALQLAKGNDIGKWFENILDWFENLFKPRKDRPLRKVHRNEKPIRPAKRKNPINKDKDEHQIKIDGILDKIGKSGYESLTKAEKDFLFKAGKED